MNGVIINGKVYRLVVDTTQDMNVCKKCVFSHYDCELVCRHLGMALGYSYAQTERMYFRE